MTQVAEGLEALVSRVAGDLRRVGLARFSAADPGEHERIAAGLGTVLHRTTVSIRPDGRTYLSRAEAVPFHTDHPQVAAISWRCEAQDAGDGASLLVDARTVIEDLGPAAMEALSTVRLPCPGLLGFDRSHHCALWEPGGRRVFYAPWLLPQGTSARQRAALEELRQAIGRAGDGTPLRIRLEPGECLAVDNRRMLHGRGPVLAGSARALDRIWIG